MNARKLGPIVILSITLVGSLAVASQWTRSKPAAQAAPNPVPTPIGTPRAGSLPPGPPGLYGDPSEYRIVYVISDAESSDPLYAPDGLIAQVSKAAIATSWDEVRQLDAVQPIEALTVHPSAYAHAESTDLEWTAALARRGVTIATLNMHTVESAALRGSGCDASRAHKYEGMFAGEAYYFLVVSFAVHAKDPALQLEAENAAFDACRSTPGTTSLGMGHHNRLRPDEESAIYVTNVIMGQVDRMRDYAFKSANPDLPPTAVPE